MSTLRQIVSHAGIFILLLSSITLHGQGEEVKKQCENKRVIIASIERDINQKKRVLDCKQHSQNCHNDLSSLNQAISNNKVMSKYQKVEERKEWATIYGLEWDPKWENDAMAFQKTFRIRLENLITRIDEYALATDIEDEIADLNMSKKLVEKDMEELGCNNEGKGPIVGKDKEQSFSDWTGTWEGKNTTVVIQGTKGSLTATFTYQVYDSKGTGGIWFGCKLIEGSWLSGDKIFCKWNVQHEDDTKSGRRNGTLEVQLSGDKITGWYYEHEPMFDYKPGYSKENVNSSMKEGAKWEITLTRKKG